MASVHQPSLLSGMCSIDGCYKAGELRRGWCSKHYSAWRRYGDPLGRRYDPPPPDGLCTEPGCSRPHQAKGLCSRHYQLANEAECSVDFCDVVASLRRGLCPAHSWQRAQGREPAPIRPHTKRKMPLGGTRKDCITCGAVKSIDEFPLDEGKPDGRHGRCKACSNAAERKRRAAAPPPQTQGSKVCIRCGFDVPLDEYPVCPGTRDGRHSWCRVCINLNRRRTYYENHDEELAKARARYVADPELHRERTRRWRRENAEDVRRRVRELRAADPGRFREYERCWEQANQDKLRANARRRRARHAAARGACSAAEMAARVDIFGRCCWVCGGAYESDDHVVPLSDGGADWPANLRPACSSCNSAKGARRIPLDEQRAAVRERFRLNGTLP